MKKLLMLILVGLLMTLSIFIVLSGFQIGTVEILSYKGIQQKSEQLDEKIQESSKLVEKDYKQAVSNVEESSKQLEQTKKEYEDMIVVDTEGKVENIGQIERYEIETLWVKLGNYATSEGAVVRIDIIHGNTSNTYNLKFTVNGSYIAITDFISDIENDSTLGFKIEDFKMIPTKENLQATFICKEIAIREISATSNPDIGIPQEENNTTQNNNSLNTTNSATATNTATSNHTNVAR